MSGTVFCYTATAVATREVSFQIDTPSILFIRSLYSVVFILIAVAVSAGGFKQLKTQRIKTHVIRNMTHFVGQFGWFFSIAFIPLAHVFAIEFTVPLWIAVLAPLFLKEKLTGKRGLIILTGFVGILFIVQPFGMDFNPASLVMLLGAIGFASAMLATRSLTRTESPLCILFYMAFLQLPISTTLVVVTGPLQIPNLTGLGLIAFITAGIMFAHYCMAKAFRLAEIMIVIPVDYLRLPLIAVAGVLLYGEPVTAAMVVGGILILSSNYANVRLGAN